MVLKTGGLSTGATFSVWQLRSGATPSCLALQMQTSIQTFAFVAQTNLSKCVAYENTVQTCALPHSCVCIHKPVLGSHYSGTVDVEPCHINHAILRAVTYE